MKESQSFSNVRIIHGQYIGGVSSSKGRLKYLQLKRNEDELSIKLPKPIGYTLTGKIQPGTMLQVWVRPHKDSLQALMVMPAEAGVTVEPPVAEPSTALPYPEHDSLESPSIAERPSSPSSSRAPSRGCTLKVCTKGKCYKQGGKQVMQALEAMIRDQNLGQTVTVEATGCLKNCKKGPTVKVSPGAAKYSFVQPQDIPKLVQRHC